MAAIVIVGAIVVSRKSVKPNSAWTPVLEDIVFGGVKVVKALGDAVEQLRPLRAAVGRCAEQIGAPKTNALPSCLTQEVLHDLASHAVTNETDGFVWRGIVVREEIP